MAITIELGYSSRAIINRKPTYRLNLQLKYFVRKKFIECFFKQILLSQGFTASVISGLLETDARARTCTSLSIRPNLARKMN